MLQATTSLSRATSFNVTNVFQFFDNFETVVCRHTYEPRQKWNLDETSLTTVQRPGKVLTQNGLKQVGQITSADRGTLVILCCCINAVGHALPPAYIFPRVNFRDHMIDGAPNGGLLDLDLKVLNKAFSLGIPSIILHNLFL